MKIVTAPEFFDSVKRVFSFRGKLREFWGWFTYHFFNKNFRKLVRTLYKSYPWDEMYLYYMEKAKIEEMRKYHEKWQRFVGVEQVIRDMRICESLIDIFTEKKAMFHYTGGLTYTKLENGDYEMGATPDFKYICDVNVNVRNADRFLPQGINEKQRQYWIEHPHEIYILKAKHLYHKIRLERDGQWWD